MCRWFAYVSPIEPCLLEDVLITPAHSLTKQVHEHYLPKLLPHHLHPPNLNSDFGATSRAAAITSQAEISLRNRLFNVDGLGLVWYTPTLTTFTPTLLPSNDSSETSPNARLRPAIYKTTQPPLHDTNFRSICANTSTKVCFAHIRAATATAITPVNNHPFVYGRHAFMHNGSISDFLAIKREMCALMSKDAYGAVQGGTDSEHMAALYITNLTADVGGGQSSWDMSYDSDEMHQAMIKTISAILRLQKDILGEGAQPSSLNTAATDGEKLVAYRFRNHAVEQPPSLYWSTTAGVTLNRRYPGHPDRAVDDGGERLTEKQHGSHIIVASEPSTYKEKEWKLLDKNTCLLVEGDGTVRVRRVEYGNGEGDYEINQ